MVILNYFRWIWRFAETMVYIQKVVVVNIFMEEVYHIRFLFFKVLGMPSNGEQILVLFQNGSTGVCRFEGTCMLIFWLREAS